MTAYYKTLRTGRRGTHTAFVWPEPGEWVEVEGDLVACENGLHVCTLPQLIDWVSEELWLVEVDEAAGLLAAGDKMVARRARLVERVTAWDERAQRLFAADCAERVLPIFEAERPDDDRPRKAIEAARAYANGEIDAAARAAAGAAAWAAAGDAAGAAAGAAAWAAAGAAAWAAADAAADAAARDAEREWQVARLAYYLSGGAA